MIYDIKLKTLFEDQFHERQQFKLNFEGDNYQGIFHDGQIQWFYPQPQNKLNDKELQDVEFKVHHLITNRVYPEIKVKPLFKDQFHEREQFKLNFEGDSYQGIFHEGKIQWFHPQPQSKLNDEDLEDVESKVHDLMSHHLEQ